MAANNHYRSKRHVVSRYYDMHRTLRQLVDAKGHHQYVKSLNIQYWNSGALLNHPTTTMAEPNSQARFDEAQASRGIP
jgi:hypothetical protein